MRTFAILAISCWSGFVLMALELLSGRILAPTFGSSIYVWGAVITVFMVALSVGYLVGGRLSMRAPRLPNLCALHALAGLLMLPVVIFAEPVLDAIFEFTSDPRAGSLIASVLLFFLPAAACGTVAPYAVRLLVQDPQAAGFYAGLQYFFSTAFSAAGTLLTSFYFVLIFDVNEILYLLVGSTFLVAGASYMMIRRSTP